jgi:hypothetical protein
MDVSHFLSLMSPLNTSPTVKNISQSSYFSDLFFTLSVQLHYHYDDSFQIFTLRRVFITEDNVIKNKFKYLLPLCSILLFSAVISLQWSTGRAFEDSYSRIYQSGQDTIIAASNPVAEEDPALVYEATKLLHATGTPQDVDILKWRLRVTGNKIGRPLALSYRKLRELEMVKKNLTLICPMVFTDRAVWGGGASPFQQFLKWPM